ncbi:TPA: topoisomerase DNA-binding C4 zinc finger domain-containing protein [Burkholderia vietnamiensis]|nr:topoisomerase DNA-binding C4 zinc finger domain-containing protein [Burkholderia vietnamiensis]
MKETRDVFKGIRFSESEVAAVQRAATAAKKKLAEYVHDAALVAASDQAETERVLDQQRALYGELAPSIGRQVAAASTRVLDDALADVAQRMDRAQARADAQMKAQFDNQFSVLKRQVDDIAATLQGLLDVLKPVVSTAPAAPAGPICPKCGTGHMVARVAASGTNAGKTFYACSAHPTCKHTSWKPDGS